MTRALTVIGAGGFGRETLDVIDAIMKHAGTPREVQVVDDSPRDVDIERLRHRQIPYIGTVKSWLALDHGDEYVIAIGNPRIREKVASRIHHAGTPVPPLVHPAATVGTQVHLSPGTVICAGVHISTNVTIGVHTHINPGAIIGHDSRLGDYVSINPGAIVSGEVSVGNTALIGAGATVLQQLTIASYATIGAGACVTRSVEHARTVKGIPAK